MTGKRKNQLAFEIARHLLEPDVMRQELLEADEEDLDVFENAMEKGRFFPGRQELEHLDSLWNLNYVASFVDGQYEVPEEVIQLKLLLEKIIRTLDENDAG